MAAQPDVFAPGQRKMIAEKFGPFLIGVFINMILYGVLLMQVLTYFQTYKKDRWPIKALIYYILVAETLNTGLTMYTIYKPLIEEYGTDAGRAHLPTLIASEPILIGAIATPVQFFIAYRIKIITLSLWIPVSICFLSLVSMAASFWTGSILVQGTTPFNHEAQLWHAVLLWLWTAAVSDILLTGTLVQALYKKKRGSFKAMDNVLNKIILLTVQTGMITALAAVLDVVFFMAVPHISINFVFGLALTKLYANCILSTLNARNGWNNALVAGQHDPNFLWDSDEGGVGKDSGSTGPPTTASGVLVFANPTPTNLESGLGVSILSHRPRTYEIEMDLLSSGGHHDINPPFASQDNSQLSVDKTNTVTETLEELLPQKNKFSSAMIS